MTYDKLDYKTQPSCLSSVNHTSSKLLAQPTQTPPPVYRTYRYYTGMKGIAPNDTPPSGTTTEAVHLSAELMQVDWSDAMDTLPNEAAVLK